jgi:hypothetical protein
MTFLATALLCGAVFAEPVCPVGDAEAEKAGGYSHAVEAAVRDAPDCEQAFAMLEACQLGSTADNPLSDLVRAKCELLFLDKANATTKKAYRKAQDACEKIAKTDLGTLYQSFGAVCLAKASRDFAHKSSAAAVK